MKSEYILLLIVFSVLFSISRISAAHYIVGIVNNALDGTSANGMNVSLWNPSRGTFDNLTDIIGINGNSHTNNVYMIDCELLTTPCRVGDLIAVRLLSINPNYTGINNATVSLTGGGYNQEQNITINSPPNITGVILDDLTSAPANEIDLIAASTRSVICLANVTESDSNNLQNATARIFDTTNANYASADDNHTHYTNNTCYVNQSYNGTTKKQVNCSFNLKYYSNPGNWRCILEVADNYSIFRNNSDTATINTLLAIQVPSSIDYGNVNSTFVSDESIINVSNAGNVRINLSLSGYAVNSGDGYAMNCTSGSNKNISVMYEKFNLTASNPGLLNLASFQSVYANLTSAVTTKRFSLNYRQQESYDDAFNLTYWRIYIPRGPAGTCRGNIVISATTNPGS
jgi:hypothetical protein